MSGEGSLVKRIGPKLRGAADDVPHVDGVPVKPKADARPPVGGGAVDIDPVADATQRDAERLLRRRAPAGTEIPAPAGAPSVPVGARAPTARADWAAVDTNFRAGRWTDVISSYRAARDAQPNVSPNRTAREQYIVALNKNGQHLDTLHEVQRFMQDNAAVAPSILDLRRVQPLDAANRGIPSMNGEVLATAGKAFRELASRPMTEQESRVVRDFARFAGDTNPTGDMSRRALELSTRFYEAGAFADRSSYAAINAAHNNLRLGNTARAERFAWQADNALAAGGGADDYWRRATALEAGVLTGRGRGVADQFLAAARAAEQPWMSETTARTLEDTFAAMRRRTGAGREDTQLGDTVAGAMRELQHNPALRNDEAWLQRTAQRIRDITGDPGGTVTPTRATIPDEFARISDRVRDGAADREWRHRLTDLDGLYRQAEETAPELRRVTNSLAEETGGRASFPPAEEGNPFGLKGRPRAEERVGDFAGDASQLVDITRSSLVYDSLPQLYRALDHIRGRADIVGIKDRIMNPMASGYRDILLKVRMPNGHVSEMQLHLGPVLDVKNGPGHDLYNRQRAIWSAADRENRAVTPAERADIARYDQEMRVLYQRAYDSVQ